MKIKYFTLVKTIVDMGSLSESAKQLHLSTSALSHQLKDIETQMDIKIFNRSRNKWDLTPEGEIFYDLATKVLRDIEDGSQTIAAVKQGMQGSIRIGTECYTFYNWLPNIILKIQNIYPDVKVEIDIKATHQPIEKLLHNQIDLAITTEKEPNPDLVYFDLFSDEIWAMMDVNHSLAQSEFLDAKDFANLHLIIHSRPLDTVAIYQHFLKYHHIQPRVISAIPMTEIALELLALNDGVICLPKWALKRLVVPSTIIYKKIGENGLKRTHYAVIRKADERKRFVVDFVEIMKKYKNANTLETNY